MKKFKLKKGDTVIVTTGKDKGKSGKISKLITDADKVIVSGVNVSKKHIKPSRDNPGKIQDKEMPLHISNVSIVDPEQGKPSRVGFKIEDGKKIRYAKLSGTILG
jgi:large subunit ribosomal protein L24